MIAMMLLRILGRAVPLAVAMLFVVTAIPTSALAASAGLAVVIANGYDDHLPASLRDAGAIADKLAENDFTTVRLLGATGAEAVGAMEQIRQAAEAAGPLRLIYMSGFGMCFNDDIVLFAEDMQPEQYKSGEIGSVVVPLSLVVEAASAGAERTLVVFDTTPRQCTRDMVNSVKLPENTVLLVTTAIGGDIVDEVDEGGMSAFASAFVDSFAAGRPIKDIVADVVAEIRATTEDQQVPIVVGEP